MKTSIFTLLFVLVTIVAYGQNRNKFHHIIRKSQFNPDGVEIIYKDKQGNYIINKKTVKVDSVTIDPATGQRDTIQIERVVSVDTVKVLLCSDERPGVITLDKGVPVIDFWQIEDDTYIDDPSCISKKTKLGRFEIDLSRPTVGDPTRYIVVPFRAWTWGVGTNPFRFRPKAGNSYSTVSTALGVSATYGRTWGYSTISPRAINHYSLTVGPFGGISSADLKKSTVKNKDAWNSSNDRTNVVLSYGLSAAIARNNLGFVVSVGFDNNFGELSKEWSYQNRPWIGLGINTNLGIL